MVNTVLKVIQNWVVNNGLKLNIKKTKYMIFTNKLKQDRGCPEMSSTFFGHFQTYLPTLLSLNHASTF